MADRQSIFDLQWLTMARKPKPRTRRRTGTGSAWRRTLSELSRWRLIRRATVLLLGLALATAIVMAVGRLEAHVQRQVLQRGFAAALVFVDLPLALTPLAEADLKDSVSELLNRDWTDESLCRDMAVQLSLVGWVARVNYVRRAADARLEISADYRLPVAMVQHRGDFILVDVEGVRLPGKYRYAPAWKLVQGVGSPPPKAGWRWVGDDLRAALDLLTLLEKEPFHGQITAVLVENFNGRVDPMRSHLELATDRAGGRIRWGSPPGLEVEENTVGQKLAILAANFRDTGRADAHHPVIDISTFPDRFTIPG